MIFPKNKIENANILFLLRCNIDPYQVTKRFSPLGRRSAEAYFLDWFRVIFARSRNAICLKNTVEASFLIEQFFQTLNKNGRS
jgi:hypothetical protein